MKTVKVVISLFALLLGCFIYLGLRGQTLLMFNWANSLGAGDLVQNVRLIADQAEFFHGKTIIYSAPFGLWVISFCALMGAIWGKDTGASATIWRLTAPAIAIGSEALQALGFLPGTFDIIDALALLCASIIGYIISVL